MFSHHMPLSFFFFIKRLVVAIRWNLGKKPSTTINVAGINNLGIVLAYFKPGDYERQSLFVGITGPLCSPKIYGYIPWGQLKLSVLIQKTFGEQKSTLT